MKRIFPEPLKAEDKEKFILDNQEAFRCYAAKEIVCNELIYMV